MRAYAAKLAIRNALDNKDASKARSLFEDALRRFPSDPELREVRDRQLLKEHEERVRTVFDRALARSSNLFGRQWLPGETVYDGETEIDLVKGRRGSGPLVPPPPVVRNALVKGYASIDRGDPAQAEQFLSGAIKKNASSPELYYARVMARALSGNLKGADEDSLKTVTLSHEQAVALSQRASLMMEMGRREEALAWASRALGKNPQDADSLAIRGRCQWWKNRQHHDLALEDLKKAAQLAPERYGNLSRDGERRFYGERALINMNKGDTKQALADADRVLAATPDDANARTVKGGVFWKAGKATETIKETTLALKADPRAKWALAFRGMAMESLGARDRALSDFKRAASLDPARFRADYERLLQAKRAGAPPLWSKDGDAVAISN